MALRAVTVNVYAVPLAKPGTVRRSGGGAGGCAGDGRWPRTPGPGSRRHRLGGVPGQRWPAPSPGYGGYRWWAAAVPPPAPARVKSCRR